MDALALGEHIVAAKDARRLLGEAHHIHLDPAGIRVPHRVMREAGKIEVAVKFAIDANQQIEIEGGGDALRIVIGGNENPLALLQIDAEQEGAAGPEQPRGLGKEAPRLRMGEIADGRAGEEAEPRLASRLRRQRARGGEVGDQWQDGETWMPPRQPPGRLFQALGGDVDRNIGGDVAERAQQQARLAARARAELDQDAALSGERGNFLAMRFEQRGLDPRRVIFFELGDLLEQLRAARIVEEAAGDAAGTPREPRKHGLGKLALRRRVLHAQGARRRRRTKGQIE